MFVHILSESDGSRFPTPGSGTEVHLHACLSRELGGYGSCMNQAAPQLLVGEVVRGEGGRGELSVCSGARQS